MTKESYYYYQETFVEKFFRYLVKVLQYCVMLAALAGLLIVYQGDKEMEALAAELGVETSTNVYDVCLEIQSIPKAEMPELEVIEAEDSTEPLFNENEDLVIEEAKLSEEIVAEELVEKDVVEEDVVEENLVPEVLEGNELSEKVEGMTPIVRTLNTTSYCACERCCGKTDGITASGAKATAWYTVAAGKKYKMGTIIYIPALADKPNGGWFVVQDRGGAISDDKLDIYLSTHSEAQQYGKKNQKCYIYEF